MVRSRFALCALLSLTACPGSLSDPAAFLDAGHDASTGGPCDIASVDTLFAQTCAVSGCHANPAPAGNVDLASPHVYARLLGQEAIDGGGILIARDGSATGSVLYEVLTSTPPGGATMPLGESPLSSATLKCVEEWIADRGVGSDAGTGDAETPEGGLEASASETSTPEAATPDAEGEAGLDAGSPVPDASHPADALADSAHHDATSADTGAVDAGVKDSAVADTSSRDAADAGHTDGGEG